MTVPNFVQNLRFRVAPQTRSPWTLRVQGKPQENRFHLLAFDALESARAESSKTWLTSKVSSAFDASTHLHVTPWHQEGEPREPVESYSGCDDETGGSPRSDPVALRSTNLRLCFAFPTVGEATQGPAKSCSPEKLWARHLEPSASHASAVSSAFPNPFPQLSSSSKMPQNRSFRGSRPAGQKHAWGLDCNPRSEWRQPSQSTPHAGSSL